MAEPRPIPTKTIHVPKWTQEDYRQRPTMYDPECCDRILAMIENGENLNAICSWDRDLPLPGTFLRWTEEEADLEERYNKALSRGAQCQFHGIPEEAALGHGLQVSAARHYTERTLPARYGPRPTILKETKIEPASDFSAELERKLEAMAERGRQLLERVHAQREVGEN